MKKYFFLAVAAVVALAACTKNEIDQTSKAGREINFNAVAGMTTKAPITSTYYGTSDPIFGMFCYAVASGEWADNHATSAAYMDNVQIKYNSTSDIWEPWSGSAYVTYYWPLSGSLTFIGYSPYKASGVSYDKSSCALTFTDFTQAAAAASQEDLMYATTNANKTGNDAAYKSSSEDVASTATGVNVVFHHALSQICFTIKKAAALTDYTITVTGLSFNAYKKGTLTVTNDSPSWGTATVDETFSVGSSSQAATTSAVAYGDAHLAVPQDLVAATQQFSITYSLAKDTVPLGSKTVDVDLRNGAITAWGPNTKYVYNITIDLDKIYFNPTIVDWTSPATEQGVDVH